MTTFKFLHAADLHLDSPLLGLTRKSAEFAGVLADASRRALDNLVKLAIDEQCRFVVLAGDIFDGDLRDFRSGLHFAKRLRALRDAGIDVFLVLGNHDAENRFVSHLKLGEVAHLFPTRKAESIAIEDLDVVVHGRSFPRRDVTENFAASYPAPVEGRFNIGVLHTACQGREEHHAPYAPCSLEQLVNHGYQYWALGHVHNRSVLSEDPWIVYPGNLQGRNPRETGPKGASLVSVADGRVVSVEPRELNAVRWETIEVDASGGESREDLIRRLRIDLQPIAELATQFPTAVRLRITGETAAHDELMGERDSFSEDVEAALATLTGDLWLERLDVRTRRPTVAEAVDPSIAGRLASEISSLRSDPGFAAALEARIAEIAAKMPASSRPQDLLDRLRLETPDRSLELALSLLSEREAG